MVSVSARASRQGACKPSKRPIHSPRHFKVVLLLACDFETEPWRSSSDSGKQSKQPWEISSIWPWTRRGGLRPRAICPGSDPKARLATDAEAREAAEQAVKREFEEKFRDRTIGWEVSLSWSCSPFQSISLSFSFTPTHSLHRRLHKLGNAVDSPLLSSGWRTKRWRWTD